MNLSEEERLHTLLQAIIEECSMAIGPNPSLEDGSPADCDAKQPQGAAFAFILTQRLIRLFEVAVEHYRSLISLTSNERPLLSAFAVARCAMEQLALAMWLLEDGIGPSGRFDRCLLLRQADLEETRKFGVSLADERGSAAVRIATVTSDAIKVYREELPSNNALKQLPSWTSLVKRFFGFESGYRIFSGAAHGNLHSVLILSGTDNSSEEELEGILPPISYSRVSARALLVSMVQIWCKSYSILSSYMGWDIEGFRTLINRQATELGLNIEWIWQPPHI